MLLIAAALLAAGAAAAAAQGVCRPDKLGTVTCPVPPPRPRPPYLADTQAIDRVRRRTPAQSDLPVFIPSWRTNRLGTTPLTGGETGIGGPCRADTLGNLICP